MLQVKNYPEPDVDSEKLDRKIYIKPEILQEFDLETKAGSPLEIDPLDLNG